jgi:hypothetical protein
MENVLVERYFDTFVDFDTFEGLNTRAPWCYEQYRLSYWGSYNAVRGDRVFCHFQAPDVESFRKPNRQHRVPFTSAWAANIIAGVAPVDLKGPKELVRLLCPDVFETQPEAEPMPQVVVIVADGTLIDDLPGRHLWTYRSRGADRTVSVRDKTSEEAVRAAAPEGTEIWDAVVRTRHILK